MMTISELITLSGMSRKELADRFDVPIRTVENWMYGKRKCPDWVVGMMTELLRHDGVIQMDDRSREIPIKK